MRTINCQGLQLRSPSGEIICKTIHSFRLGDEEVDKNGSFHRFFISVREITGHLPPRFVVWDTAGNSMALTFIVTQTSFDIPTQIVTVEGRTDRANV